MKVLLRNPLTQWLWWLAKSWYIKRSNVGKNLEIGYLSTVSASTFGRFNRICAGAMLSAVSMGDMSYVGERSRLSRVTVGKFTCIGPEVLAGLGKHPSRGCVSSHPAFFSSSKRAGRSFVSETSFTEYAPITIGHDVWIGARAILLDGVTVGTGAIVGAGAVVTTDIPPYAVAVGVPAKVLRMRFTEEQIALLLESTWWNVELDELERCSPSFASFDLFKQWKDGARQTG